MTSYYYFSNHDYGYGAALVAGCVYILGGEWDGDVEMSDRIEIRDAKAGSTRNLLVSECSAGQVMMERCTEKKNEEISDGDKESALVNMTHMFCGDQSV